MECIFCSLRYGHSLESELWETLDLKYPKYSLPILMKKQKVQGSLGAFTAMERRESGAGSS